MGRHWSPGNDDLPDSGVTPGVYGDATDSAQITVDAAGRITAATAVPITGGGGGGGGGIGASELIYRYTVTGSDKASIDTGVDTPAAGSNDWTGCDLLEIVLSARTDEAAQGSNVALTFNNDTGSVYDYVWNRIAGTTLSGVSNVAQAAFLFQVTGANVADTSIFGTADLKVPNPTGTVANKTISGTFGFAQPADSTNQQAAAIGGAYRPASPAALTRLKVTPNTSLKKLKVGSQLLIYKRLAS